ncbi:hypothetical protein ACCW76_18415 [Pantoea sp. C8B4]|uniref:hypothetical protein n=1 Tax=Pantoea sp. C8B4 TaxID=3243083 RepID=UPI003ED83F31
MVEFNNFQSGKPKLEYAVLLWERHGVGYIFDEKGKDWYACQASFSNHTLKVAFDKDGIIRSISRDVSALWPVGLSVGEVSEGIEEVDTSGCWKYDKGMAFKISDNETDNDK